MHVSLCTKTGREFPCLRRRTPRKVPNGMNLQSRRFHTDGCYFTRLKSSKRRARLRFPTVTRPAGWKTLPANFSSRLTCTTPSTATTRVKSSGQRRQFLGVTTLIRKTAYSPQTNSSWPLRSKALTQRFSRDGIPTNKARSSSDQRNFYAPRSTTKSVLRRGSSSPKQPTPLVVPVERHPWNGANRMRRRLVQLGVMIMKRLR